MANINNIQGSDKIKDTYATIYNNDSAINTEVGLLDTRVDNIISSSGTSDTEVVDARYDSVYDITHTLLKTRLDASSQRSLTIDVTNTINYSTQMKIINGKPVLEYEEVL
jgi:hypothetical protein